MKKAILLFAFLCAFAAKAWATDVTVGGQTLASIPFNPDSAGIDITRTVTVTNASPTVTCSSCFPASVVGIGGFQVSIAGVQYVVQSIASSSSMTLTTNYAASSGSATLILYKYVLLRVFNSSSSSFQPAGSTEIIMPGGPANGQFYKQFACSIINSGSGNVLWIPQFVIPATTDALISSQATLSFAFVRPSGASLNELYRCGSKTQLRIPPNTPTSFPAICNFNAPGVFSPAPSEAYLKNQIDDRLPGCSTNSLVYYASTGNRQTCLALGAGLSITSGVINSSGGGGATINPTDTVVPYRLNGTTFADSSVSIGSSLATQISITARNATTSSYAIRLLTPADTALTASTEAPMLQVGGNVAQTSVTRQWATGALTTQREHVFLHPTYAFVGASTITNAATVAITNAPIAGTNATITNPFAFWVQGGNTRLDGLLGINMIPVAQLDVTSAADATIAARVAGTATATGDILQLKRGSTIVQEVMQFGDVLITPAAASSGSTAHFRIVAPGDTSLTASAEAVGVNFDLSSTRQHATGAITTQRDFLVQNTTHSFVAASTITTAATLAIVAAPVAGTNATITNAYSLWVQAGDSRFDGRVGVNQATTLGQFQVTSSADATNAAVISGTATAASSILVMRRGGAAVAQFNERGHLNIQPAAQSSGTPTPAVNYDGPAHTSLANVEWLMTSFNFNNSSTQFAGGGAAIGTQRAFFIANPIYTAAAAQTITTAATLAIGAAPSASTNITITNAYSLWVQAGTTLLGTPSTSTGALRFAVSGSANTSTLQAADTPASTLTFKWPSADPTANQVLTAAAPSGGVVVLSWAAGGGGGGNCTVAGVQGDYQINNGASGCAAGVITQGTNGRLIASPTAVSSGATNYFRIVTPADTSLTLSTEAVGIVLGGTSASPPATVTRQWATGTLTLQREVLVTAPTYGFVGASTLTDAITMEITGPPVAGTNATLTRRSSLSIVGGLANVNDIFIRNDDQGPGNNSFIIATRDSGGQDRLQMDRGNWLCFEGGCTVGNRFTSGTLSLRAANIDIAVVAGTTGANSFKVTGPAGQTVDLLQFNFVPTNTSTVASIATFGANSNGTAAAGFGQRISFNLESSTTNDQLAAQMDVSWTTATHASRVSNLAFNLVDNAVTGEAMALRGNGQIKYYGLKRQTADVTKTSDTTLADLTGLTFNLVTGRTYKVRLTVFYNTGAATAGGAKLAFGGTATFSALIGSGYAMGTANTNEMVVASSRRVTATGSTIVLVGTTESSTGGTAYAEATLVCNGTGTLTVQGAQQGSSATSTVFLTNSLFEIWEVSN